MGFCFPFNLGIQEWIIGIILAILIILAIWKEKDEKNWNTFSKEVIKKGKDKGGISKYIHIFQKLLHYTFRGFIIRQILNPYFLFPFLILLIWLLKINNWSNGEIVLTATLIVVLWYSKETQVLREEQRKSNKIAKELMIEQKKLVYLQALEMEMKDKDSGYKVRTKYPLLFRRIVEKGEFDPKALFSNNWHQDL